MWTVTWKGLLANKLRLALTALAVVLGVTFVSGTFVLTDTLHHTFTSLFDRVYSRVDFQVRAESAFTGAYGTAVRPPIPDSTVATVAGVPGVKVANGTVGGTATLVDKNGKAIVPLGPPRIGLSWDPNPQLSSLAIVSGHAPTRSGQVVIDRGTAQKYGFAVGDKISIIFQQGPGPFTVVGIARFGDADNLAGATIAAFDFRTAQQVLNRTGQVDAVSVLADPGVDKAALKARIEKALPAGMEVSTGKEVARENSSVLNNSLAFFSTALLVFALISLFVGAFIIFNTFSILVSQRTRDLALLRALGASRRQVLVSVLLEAAVVGVVASVIGLALGALGALGLEGLMNAIGFTVPSTSLQIQPRTAVVSMAVGVGVTLCSAIIPARRAVEVQPMAAMRQNAPGDRSSLRGRITFGAVLTGLGVVALLIGLAGGQVALVGLGALVVFIGVAALAPLIARPCARVIGAPVARFGGTPGRLGRDNAMRSPRRTAATAAALMVGIALVTTMTIFGSSVAASATSSIDKAVVADYIIGTQGFSPFSAGAQSAVDGLSDVRATSAVLLGQFKLRQDVHNLSAVSPVGLSDTVILQMREGQGAPALIAGKLLVDTNTARSEHLHVGDTVPVTFAKTGRGTMVVGGVYEPNQLLGSYLIGDGAYAQHFSDTLPIALLVRTNQPASAAGKAELKARLASYPDLVVRTQAEFKAYQRQQVNQLLALVYALLGLAILIALLGIVNTLALSVIERTHEIGLLRAIGMKRRQIRKMIRSEALIIAIYGSLMGTLLGIGFGIALQRALQESGITELAVPVGTLVVFLVMASLAGMAASIWPARRAARLDVLDAITSE